jgi:hypothetical protein
MMPAMRVVAAWMVLMFAFLIWNYTAHLNDPPDNGDPFDRR